MYFTLINGKNEEKLKKVFFSFYQEVTFKSNDAQLWFIPYPYLTYRTTIQPVGMWKLNMADMTKKDS